ncbi:MAG: HAMP domain-containing sensor histidine kinase [bacterium]
MNEQEIRIAELQHQLSASKELVQQVLKEQQLAAKLLIRRDLSLSRANEQLMALDVAKSEFISIAAHQLRTPLSAIKWILYMLINNEFNNNEEREQFTEKAAQSTDRMIDLVNDLLEVDHIQLGKDQFIFVPLSVSNLIKAIISELQTIITKRKINMVINLDSCPEISGDETKLRELFQNLIENALKYTPVEGTVRITSSSSDGFLKIEVADSGIGIPEDQKYHIFSKFFRAANAMKVETVGSGLGLFIAKEVTERHGGKIWFESTVGQGSVFHVQLPLNPDKKFV